MNKIYHIKIRDDVDIFEYDYPLAAVIIAVTSNDCRSIAAHKLAWPEHEKNGDLWINTKKTQVILIGESRRGRGVVLFKTRDG